MGEPKEGLDLYDEANFLIFAATSSNSEIQNELLSQKTATSSVKQEMASQVKIQTKSEQACKRCEANDKLAKYRAPTCDFYCDCGMRAVLRKLRNEILADLNFSHLIHSQYRRDRQLLQADLVQWFKNKLVAGDVSSSFRDADKPEFTAMVNFLLALDRTSDDDQLNENSGCQGKRRAKQKRKSLLTTAMMD